MRLESVCALAEALGGAGVRCLFAGGFAVRAGRPKDLDDVEHLRLLGEAGER